MTEDPNSIAGRVARGMSYGPISNSILRRMTVQNASLVRRCLEMADQVIRATAHDPGCKFAACTCGAVERFKELRSEFYRLWRQINP